MRHRWLTRASLGAGALRLPALSSPVWVSAASMILIQTGNALTGIILARSLGPEVRGQVAALVACSISLSTVFGLSLSEALIYRASVAGNDRARILGSAIAISLASSVTCATVMVLFSGSLLPLSGGLTAWQLIPWVGFTGLAQLSLLVQTLARAVQRFNAWFWLRVLATWAYAATLLIVFLVTDLNKALVGWANFSGAAVTILAGIILLYRGIDLNKAQLHSTRLLLSYGIRLHPVTLAGLFRDQLDKVVLAGLVPAADLGKYVAAIAIGTLIAGGAASLEQVLFPRLSQILDDRTRIAEYSRIASKTFIASIVISPLVVAAAPLLARVMFGKSFVDQPWLILAGAGLGILQGLKVVINMSLKVSNLPGALGRNEAIGTALGFTTLLLLVGSMGIYAAPIAGGVGSVISMSLTFHRFLRVRRELPGNQRSIPLPSE